MSKYNLWVINKDCCPEDDVVVIQGQCACCKHYHRFKMEFGQPCVVCSFYAIELDINKQ